MAQSQFISHAQVIPPPTAMPRRESGAFSALLVVIIILGAAAAGGVILLEKNYAKRIEDAKSKLVELQKDLEVGSIKDAQELQQKIDRAEALLKSHVYASQALNFIESSTLGDVNLTAFSYNNGEIKIEGVTRGYLPFAQQMKIYRSEPAVESFQFPNPSLNERGEVVFSLAIKLKSEVVNSKPESTEEEIPAEISTSSSEEPNP